MDDPGGWAPWQFRRSSRLFFSLLNLRRDVYTATTVECFCKVADGARNGACRKTSVVDGHGVAKPTLRKSGDRRSRDARARRGGAWMCKWEPCQVHAVAYSVLPAMATMRASGTFCRGRNSSTRPELVVMSYQHPSSSARAPVAASATALGCRSSLRWLSW